MSLQSILNKEAFDLIPKVSKIIKEAEQHEKDQMVDESLRRMMNTKKPLIEMSEKEIDEFQDYLISIFKFNEWIK